MNRMYAFLLMAFTFSAYADFEKSVTCGDKRTTYHIEVSSDHRSAKVSLKGNLLRAGDLSCTGSADLDCKKFPEARVSCESIDAAPTEFWATVFCSPTQRLVVELEAVTRVRSEILAYLPCTQAH